MLVRTGIGSLTLIDPERLDAENIARHILTQKDLGKPKVEAIRERLIDINSECKINVHFGRYEEVLSKADLLVSGADSYR